MVLNHDKHFLPMICVLREFKKEVLATNHKTLKICVERNKGYNFVYTLDIFDDANKNEENYGVAFRKGSDVTEAVNKVIAELVADGTLPALAEKYGLALAPAIAG